MPQPEKSRSSGPRAPGVLLPKTVRGEVTIQVTGKNVEASETYKSFVTDRIAAMLDKFFGPELSGHVRMEKERGRFHTHISVRLKTGLMVEVHGDGVDDIASADLALERLEKRVRRYKRRLKDRHSAAAARAPIVEIDARDSAAAADDEIDEPSGGKAPVIVAEPPASLSELPVSRAVLELDVAGRPFLLFRNAAHGRINVVYRRADGNIGWIDQIPGNASGATSEDGKVKT